MYIIHSPTTILLNNLLGAIRSSVFLAVFVSGYQSIICIHRKLTSGDHKLLYYLAGFLCSASVFIEEKSRRSGMLLFILFPLIIVLFLELALYVLPRAADSLFMIFKDRKWLGDLPWGEVVLFSLSMGVIMRSYQVFFLCYKYVR
jgi:hypothetical protein